MNELNNTLLEGLKNLEVAPSERVWSKVEASLPPQHRLPAWWWLPVAASVMLALFVYKPEVRPSPLDVKALPAAEDIIEMPTPAEGVASTASEGPTHAWKAEPVAPTGAAKDASNEGESTQALHTEGLAAVQLEPEGDEEVPATRPSVKVKMNIRPRVPGAQSPAEAPGLSHRMLLAASSEFKDLYGRTEQEAQRLAGTTLRLLRGEPNEMSNQSP